MDAPELQDSIDIAATPAQVWAMVSDVRRMPEWSPQVRSTRLRAGFDEPALGAQFTNRNGEGDLVWTTHAEIIRFEPETEIAFRVEENWLIWSFLIEPAAAGTRLTQRRQAPDGVSQLSLELTNGFMGGVETFTDTMRAGMRQTLERIKVAAEGSAGLSGRTRPGPASPSTRSP
jgi:uncharacterized protein YndB with AHSA1/START domain